MGVTLAQIAKATSSPAAGDFLVGTTAASVDQIWTQQQLAATGPNTFTSSHILALTDFNTVVEMNAATANNLTIPLNATVNFPVGTSITITQFGAGVTTIVAAGGVTTRAPFGLAIKEQFGGATLFQRAINDWYVWVN